MVSTFYDRLSRSKIAWFLGLLGKIKLLPKLDDCRILAVDNDIDVLKQCFPPFIDYFHVPIRGEVIYVDLSVAFWLVRLLVTRQRHRMGLRGCYISAIAKTINPGIIITLIDNNNWDLNLSKYLGIPVICIANGLRHPESLRKKHFDCYFALSKAPLDDKLPFDFSFDEFHTPGHLKMGLYIEEFGCINRASRNKRAGILWISQYREAIYTSSQQHHIEHRETELLGIGFMSRFAVENNYTARVAIASERKRQNRKTETDLFTSVSSGNLKFPDNHTGRWSSYHEVSDADLIFSIHSTLLFESLSVGKRVVFMYPDRYKALRSHVAQAVRLDLLAPLVYAGDTYQTFSAHCVRILNMSDAEYAVLIEDIRKQVAPFDRNYLPQHQIRDKINLMLSG